MSLLEFTNVSFNNREEDILKGISVSINSGDFMSIMGPSGSGKSTFLRLCCHLISPTDGTLLFHGQPIDNFEPTDLRKKIAYCFQTPYLFGDRVRDNIEFPYIIRNLPVDDARVKALFSSFQMTTDYLEKEIKNLSGGEKQRIALIRSLLFTPEILLLDEVTSALDVANTAIVEHVVTSLHNEGTTILWITHNPEQGKRHANKVLTIKNGEIQALETIL
ncbi:ATP-binding cassette domain-containing protein [Sporolactobacillus shoreicorticis]|uniref:ATP-binding cassette domain-containing protein n=1 Tax=Sporolactobacillus shoreicorticis TaxID=1923877 RepID=A0ABW5S5D7_9BACL|nr:ATP-binding cassette domain-containing protein [Sporolactobacillus shoreicorticis]MCO7124452.1 ATP-binding cassette domain-containing protein [Sporolactobacillus shoreicorticis]